MAEQRQRTLEILGSGVLTCVLCSVYMLPFSLIPTYNKFTLRALIYLTQNAD